MFAQETLQQSPKVGTISSLLTDEEARDGAETRSGHVVPPTLLVVWLDSSSYLRGLLSSQVCGHR